MDKSTCKNQKIRSGYGAYYGNTDILMKVMLTGWNDDLIVPLTEDAFFWWKIDPTIKCISLELIRSRVSILFAKNALGSCWKICQTNFFNERLLIQQHLYGW